MLTRMMVLRENRDAGGAGALRTRTAFRGGLVNCYFGLAHLFPQAPYDIGMGACRSDGGRAIVVMLGGEALAWPSIARAPSIASGSAMLMLVAKMRRNKCGLRDVPNVRFVNPVMVR